jgi:hypothetical protein
MTLLQSWFWPDVGSRKNALAAINETFWVILFLAGLTAVFTLIGFARDSQEGDRLWGLVSAACLAGVAFGIRRKSRSAAVAGFALYIAGRAWAWMASGHPGSVTLFVLVSLALWHGVRGTFAFHRFAPSAAGTPSIEDSFRSFGQPPKRTQPESERKQG